MAILSPSYFVDLLLLLVAIISAYFINFKINSRKLWKRRGILYNEPTFLLGNRTIPMNESLKQLVDRYYTQFRNEKLAGLWLFSRPALVIIDLDLLKNIFIKDFSHFHDRGLYVNEKDEPLTGHLFSLGGQKWRNLRVKLTPTFTSGKMKMMFDAMQSIGMRFQHFLREPAEAGDVVELKSLMASFTTEVISSCAFGIEANSLGNPDCLFQKYGRSIFQPNSLEFLERMVVFSFPRFSKLFQLRSLPRATSDFFMKTVTDVMEQREKVYIKRNDFMDLLLQLKNQGYIDDADLKYSKDAKDHTEKFTVEEAAAQAFVFLVAGFETSSTALMFTAFELARNPEIQDRLQKEIDEMLKKENGVVSYAALQQMEYMDQVVQESLRKYAPLPVTFRKCTKRYQIPNSDCVIEEGEFLLIPIQAIQSDPQYFPDPDKYDPVRFSKEQCETRDPFLNLAFGNGPRNCIGSRFGLQQIKVGLISVLSKYRLEVADDTPKEIELNKRSLVPTPIGGIPLKISTRKL